MILKRIVPVISALVILVCMLAVPASAASMSDSVSLGSRPFADIDVYVQADNAGDDISLSISHPERILDPECYISGTIDSNSGSAVFYQIYSHSALTTDSHIAMSPEWAIYQFSFSMDDFVVPCNRSVFAALFDFHCYDGDSCSFSVDVSYVSEEGKPRRTTLSFSFDGRDNSYINPFSECSVYDRLLSLGVAPDSYVLFSDFNLRVFLDLDRSNVLYRVYCPPVSYNSFDFLFNNEIEYGPVIVVEDSTNPDLLFGFSSFLTDGVGAFLATPLFGTLSLGDLLAGVVAILFALVIIRLFSS